MRRWFLGGLFLLLALMGALVLIVMFGGAGLIPTRIRGLLPGARGPIVVGLIHSQTGPLAISEESLLDAEVMALEEINNRGGISGRRLTWEIVDGRSDPLTFASQATRLIESSKVEVIVGGWSAECRKALLEVVERKESLLIFPANFEGIERSSHAIYTGGSANQVILPAVRWSFDALKARRFFVVGTEEVWSRVASELAKDGIKATGAELAGEAFLPLTGGDVRTLIESIRAAKPDVVLNALIGESNVPFYAALQRAGLTADKLPVVAFAVSEEEMRRFSPGVATGHYSAFSYFQGLDRPENADFVRKFKARPQNEKRVVCDAMVAAYNGLMLWAQAAEEAGTADPKIVMTRFDRQSLDAPEGIVTIDPESRVAWRPFCVGKVRPDGQFDLAWSISKPAQPVTYPATRSKAQWQDLLVQLQARWGGRWSSSEVLR